MQNVIIKTPQQIAKIREAAELSIRVLEGVAPLIQPGVTTIELDRWCHDYIVEKLQAIPAPLHYRGYPKSICTSVNQEICHGIPSSKVKLKEGDIVNVDVTVKKDGFYADTSKMFCVGACSSVAKKLVQVAKEALYLSIKAIGPGVVISKVGEVIQPYVEARGFSVVRDYCGHGVGLQFHEDPHVLHYLNRNPLVLRPGMIFTIEPMVNEGTYRGRELKNGWTVVTMDGKLSAQWEHTLLITESGVEVLTLRDEEVAEFQAI